MTRKAEKAFLGRIRSEEYQNKRKRDTLSLLAFLGLYVGVPVLWWGAVEFGLVKPIQTEEFRSALNLARLAGLIVLITLANRWYDYRSDDRKLKEFIEARESGEEELAEARSV